MRAESEEYKEAAQGGEVKSRFSAAKDSNKKVERMRKDGLERMNKAYGNDFCRLDFDSKFEYITKISEFLMEFFLHELIRHIARHTYKS